MLKIIVGAVAAVLLLALGTASVNTTRQQHELEAIERAADRGQLKWYAKRAKIKGEKQAVFRAGIPYYVAPKDLDEALAYYDVVLAEVADSKSTSVHPMEIETWYKFRVVEHLSRKEIADCPTCPGTRPPLAEMLPLNGDEILIPKGGGVMEVDGVKLFCVDPDFPPFAKSRQYLLFLDLNPSTRVGSLRMGPSGVYLLNPGNVLKPVNAGSRYKVNDEITAKYGDSLTSLKDSIEKRAAGKAK